MGPCRARGAHLQAARGGTVIFKDDFSDPKSGWDIGSNAREAVGYHGGAYFIKVKRRHWSFVASNPSAPAPKDVALEVTAQNVTRRSDTLFGIFCRAHGSGTRVLGYGLAIYDDGTYGITRGDRSHTVLLIKGASPKISRGSAIYMIAAVCTGPLLSLFVDGKKIVSVKDSTYKGGSFGLEAGTDSSVHGVREVRFTNLIVRKP
jgi:hypothetical protein